MSTEQAIAVIPARGNSKGVPRKNIRLLGGKPLIAYTLESAMKAQTIECVVVSTEDDDITRIASAYGVQVIRRPANLAQDDTPMSAVQYHAIAQFAVMTPTTPPITVLLQPTSPFRTPQDIDNAVHIFRRTHCHAVVSVCEVDHPIEWTYHLSGESLVPVLSGTQVPTRRQDAITAYRLNGAIYVMSTAALLRGEGILEGDMRAYTMPKGRSLDIDNELDLKLAEVLMSAMGEPPRNE